MSTTIWKQVGVTVLGSNLDTRVAFRDAKRKNYSTCFGNGFIALYKPVKQR